MAIPATVGQLRTKVSEMEIGDYIIFNYNRSNGTFLLNETTGGEVPYTGVVDGTGACYCYLIKTAKGLLIGDRVILNTVSWDSLNSGKYIQGIPWDAGNIIPTMTSNTSPSGVASASSRLGSTYDAWYAFDKKTRVNEDVMWMASNDITTGWLAYEFSEPKVIKRYSLKSRSASPTSAPKTWTFEGSKDGLEWVILDSRYNQVSTVSGETRTYDCNNSKEYKHYRINITESNGTDVGIEELEMYDTVGIIRSLTGGVTYADENGNKSTTDLGFGAFPTNNEWDKYIVNFPQEKIQAGKTLDDVFHWSGIYTWTQDTAMIGMISGSTATTSNKRIIRGNTNINRTGWGTSSTATSMSGFRPVFVYNE